MEFRDYLKVLRRRWRLVIGCVLVVVAVTAIMTLRTTPQYASTIRLFVSTPQADSAEAYQGGLFSEQRVTSYADLAAGPEIARRVVDRLHLETGAAALSGQISASVVPKTVILHVTVTDPDPRRAQRLVEAVGQEFTEFVRTLETAPNKSRPAIKASVLGPPNTPAGPVSPQPVRNIGLAGLLGLLLGVGAAFLRETFDTSIRVTEELAALTRAPVFGSFAFEPTAAERPIITEVESHAPRVEAFRMLRTNLQFVDVDQPTKVFVITSSVPHEGKTTTACNLAITLAQAGQRVALVEGDLRRPKVAEYLHLEAMVGLTTVLIGRVDLASAMQQCGDHGLHVLTSGAIPPDPAELLQSRTMSEIVGSLRNAFDIILVDAPPLLPVTDGALLAAQADGALLVVRHGKTTRDQVRGSAERLQSVDARLIGTLLNMCPQRGDSGASGYYYGYGYAPAPNRAPDNGLVAARTHLSSLSDLSP